MHKRKRKSFSSCIALPVFAAYDWDPSMSDDDLLAALLALNLERAADQDAT